ncbi:MAG: hypothetical protein ABJE47_14950 [bacterium]
MKASILPLLCGLALPAAVPARAVAQASDRDSALFVVLVKSMNRDTVFARHGLHLQVDTLPVVDDPDAQAYPDLWASFLGKIAARRSRVLKAMGMPTGNSSRPENCGGIMMVHDPTGVHRGCPKEERIVAVVGLPRDTTEGAGLLRKNVVTVRVVTAEIGPGGFSYQTFRYRLESKADQWVIIGYKLVDVVE